MKNIKFYNLPNQIKHLTFDGDKTDLRLHNDEMFSWGAKTKKEYNKAVKEIDSINYEGNGWKIYAWYDISGYDYWMKNMEEPNYIQITISFDKGNVSTDEVIKISNALEDAICEADAIQNRYSYNPYLAD